MEHGDDTIIPSLEPLDKMDYRYVTHVQMYLFSRSQCRKHWATATDCWALVAGLEGFLEAPCVQLCRVNYRSKFLEWTFELFWPVLVLAVGLFASISALTYV